MSITRSVYPATRRPTAYGDRASNRRTTLRQLTSLSGFAKPNSRSYLCHPAFQRKDRTRSVPKMPKGRKITINVKYRAVDQRPRGAEPSFEPIAEQLDYGCADDRHRQRVDRPERAQVGRPGLRACGWDWVGIGEASGSRVAVPDRHKKPGGGELYLLVAVSDY